MNGITVFVHEYDVNDQKLILESKDKGTAIDNQYSYKKHSRHNPTGEYHLHVYKRGNEIFSINKSGRAHDGYSGERIPNEVYNALKNKFPDWSFPDNQIIESLNSVYSQNPRAHLRPVTVLGPNGYSGYFHTFGNDPFSTGGNGGWKDKIVALIEKEDGQMAKVSVDNFKFKDV